MSDELLENYPHVLSEVNLLGEVPQVNSWRSLSGSQVNFLALVHMIKNSTSTCEFLEKIPR